QHFRRIARVFPDFDDFLPYRKPPGLIDIQPGYALDDRPGSITDDTYIRADLSSYVIETQPPYTAPDFAQWLLQNADFSNWWSVAVDVLKRIKTSELNAEDAGLSHVQGGGGGWWQPVAVLNAGRPAAAAALTAELCRIWKAPLEQDILSAVVAGQAAVFAEGATIDSIVNAILAYSGPLASRLFERAVTIAQSAQTTDQLYEQLYAHCLVETCTTSIDGDLPPVVTPLPYTDDFYNGILFAEQQPLALAYFVFGQGDPYRTVLTAVKGGRDADSIATNTASWLGAMSGTSIWPQHWLDQVQRVNIERLNLMQLATNLAHRAVQLGNISS
ncbi:MAG: ADP-ribosylglycohydrolase family protein, partial [Anaerolineae bacterium]|nr:ADP-ribosylglycohydrolase family protein [Anaerolineae bacterium]